MPSTIQFWMQNQKSILELFLIMMMITKFIQKSQNLHLHSVSYILHALFSPKVTSQAVDHIGYTTAVQTLYILLPSPQQSDGSVAFLSHLVKTPCSEYVLSLPAKSSGQGFGAWVSIRSIYSISRFDREVSMADFAPSYFFTSVGIFVVTNTSLRSTPLSLNACPTPTSETDC